MLCKLCPRQCGVERDLHTGYCGAFAKTVRVALVSLHKWEEPCLVGADGRGAGTIFFSHCVMRCCYCQNWEISQKGCGKEISIERLANIFLEQQKRGAATLDLVTPTHYTPQICRALDIAKKRGFILPVVWNSDGYETEKSLESLRDYVSIFLPDMKYIDEKAARLYSQAPRYPEIAMRAIKKMFEIAGAVQFNQNGQLFRGVIIRHMVLPSRRKDAMRILDWIAKEFGDAVQVSIMRQYTPMYRAAEHKEINRKLTTFEYESVLDYARKLGLYRCYIQEKTSANKTFVPVFDGSGV